MAKKKLAPVVMYHSYFDPMNTDVMASSLSYLKQLGYTNFCLEYSSDQSLAKFYQTLKTVASIEFEDPRLAEVHNLCAKSSLDMFKTAESLGMKILFIDPMPLQKSEEVVNRSNPEEMEEARGKRDRIMAQTIARIASEENGGVIASIGLGHLDLQTFLTRELEKTPGALKPLYVLFRSTDSGYAKNWEQISQLAESGRIYNVSMLEPEFRKARFPEGIEFFNAPMSKKQEVGKAFQELVADRVKLYEFITEEETSVTKTLTDLLRLKAKVKIAKKFGNSDEYECDAVWDITDCVDSKRYAVCVSISYKLPFVHKKDMGRDYLVIENVNREEVAEKILSRVSSRSR